MMHPSELILTHAQARVTGPWHVSTDRGNSCSEGYLSIRPGVGANRVRWTPDIPAAGNYEVYYWLPDGDDTITMNANFKVFDSIGEHTYQVYERAGGQWVLLGKHHFHQGSMGYIEIDDAPEGGGTVIADAIKIVPEPPQPCRVLHTGHLIDEMFQSFDGSPPSGWLIQGDGGTACIRTIAEMSKVLAVHVDRPDAELSMAKEFLPQSGTITMEYKFRTAMDVAFELRQETIAALKLKTKNGSLVYENARGTDTFLQAYRDDEWIGVKIIADIAGSHADIYIDGQWKAAAEPFRSKVSTLTHAAISTGTDSVGDLHVSVLRVYKGYHLYEKFLTERVGGVPSGWMLDSEGGTGRLQSIVNGQKPFEANVFQFDDTSDEAGVVLYRNFAAQTGMIQLEYKFMLPKKLDGVSMELGRGAECAVKILTCGGAICCETGAGGAIAVVPSYKANVWYDMRIVADCSSGKASISVNHGVAEVKGCDFRHPVSGIDQVRFSTPSVGTGEMLIADIFVFDYAPPSAVPEPIIAAPASGQFIGPQMFGGGFREGAHAAWGSIISSPARKPLLGWYDEGNTEVADWELKWMLEHGMNMISALWFRGLNSIGTAPRTSRKELPFNAMLDSKFIDRMKVWIVWENVGRSAEDMKDWQDNLVPYWIEHYFKHPSYLTIDNKPVFGLLSNPHLMESLGGSESDVASALSYFRQAAGEEGFTGVILVAMNKFANPAELQSLKNCGYDYIYAYNWRSADGSDAEAMAAQQGDMLAQNKLGSMDIIPSISVSWDSVPPWFETGRRFRLSPGNFRALAEWVRDVYMPQLRQGSLGRNMMLIDNWNEYGEGHWIHPTADYGFAYLDAIREVFTTAPRDHIDTVPEDVGLGPYDLLFPQGWTARGNAKKYTPGQ